MSVVRASGPLARGDGGFARMGLDARRAARLARLSAAMLGAASYICLSASDGRYEDIARDICAYVVRVQGTQRRWQEHSGDPHEVRRIGDHTLVEWGYGRGSYTNKSAGVALLVANKTWKRRDIIAVDSPPLALQGRGGNVEVEEQAI